MASPTSVRVYVGGLPADIKANELHDRFGNFVATAMDCQLTHVELPNSKPPGNSVVPNKSYRGFAYLTLQGTDAAMQSEALRKTYNRTKWRGTVLKVQVAKPHFKLKLKQEKEKRELEKKEREVKRREQMMQLHAPSKEIEPMKVTVIFKGRKTTTFSDVDKVNDVVKEEEVKVPETDTKSEIGVAESEREDKVVKEKSFGEDDVAESESEDEKIKDEVLGEDDVEAFMNKMEKEATEKKQTKEEKIVIPAIGEAVGNKKITFDDSGNEQESEKQGEGTGVVLNWMNSSDDEANGVDRGARETIDFTNGNDTETTAADVEAQAAFALRPEFVGEKGKKLFEMQKRFGGDSRFRLDARFLEEEANEYGGNDVGDDDQQVDEKGVTELQNFLEEEGSQEAAHHAREMREEEEAALRIVSKLFPDVDVMRLQRRMQEQRAPKDPLKEAAWMGELKRYDPRDAHACREFEIPMTIASSDAQEDKAMTALPKREEKEIPTGGDQFFSTAGNLSNLFSRVRKNSEDGEEGEAALDGVFGIGTATTETGSDAPFKLSSLFSFPVGEDKPLAAMGEQLLEDDQEERGPSAGDWAFSQGVHPTDDMVDEGMATDSEAGDDAGDEVQTKAALIKKRAKKGLEEFLAFGRTFVGGKEVADWPERRKKLTLDYKRKRRDAVKMKKRQKKQQNKANKTKTDATAPGTSTSSRWKKTRL
ncbi:unnamed protein product [Peronospora destructor]|uniref:RRM domain-containing protein n=1 Tax=Peronospora destructor TaxID=86335 RepID=A0AAV0TIA0_9STRA|nr:unnamed protein product [Peronospora destructor]